MKPQAGTTFRSGSFAGKRLGISEPSCATAGVQNLCFPVGCQRISCIHLSSSLVNPRKPRSIYISLLSRVKHLSLCSLSSAVHIWLMAPSLGVALVLSSKSWEQQQQMPPLPQPLCFYLP